jgi:O-antigen ligase
VLLREAGLAHDKTVLEVKALRTTIHAASAPAVVAGRPGIEAAKPRLDFLRFAVALLIVMVVSRVHQIIPGLGALRPALVFALGSFIYAFLHPRALTPDNVMKFWWSRAILVVAAQAVLSAVFGISLGNSGQFILFDYSTVLILAGLVIVAARTTVDLVVFVVAFMVGTAALAWQTNFMFHLTHGAGLERLSTLHTFDANDAGLMFVAALPVAVALVTVWKGWKRAAMVVLIAGIGVGIARTGSRGAFLALLVSGALMLVLNRGVPFLSRVGISAAVVIALAVAAPPGYFKQMMTMSDPTTDYNWTSPTGRREVSKRGIGYMLSYPLFGVGIDNFAKAECTISERFQQEALDVGIRCTPPHNTWVQAGAELGVPGLIFWAAMLLIPFVKLLRLSRRLPLSWRSGDLEQRFLFACAGALPIALVGFMVASTFLTFAWLDLPYLLVILAGLTWLFARRRLAADAPVRAAATAPAGRPGRRFS